MKSLETCNTPKEIITSVLVPSLKLKHVYFAILWNRICTEEEVSDLLLLEHTPQDQEDLLAHQVRDFRQQEGFCMSTLMLDLAVAWNRQQHQTLFLTLRLRLSAMEQLTLAVPILPVPDSTTPPRTSASHVQYLAIIRHRLLSLL
jgi:hypothetical protein